MMEALVPELPNGFHDGELHHLAVDFAAATLTLDVEFWIGETGTGRPHRGLHRRR
jgi:hypothetical protein